MIRWNSRSARVALAVSSLVSLAIASGAGARWDAVSILNFLGL